MENGNDRNVWEFERNIRFTNRLLVGSFTDIRFNQITRISYTTFNFCERLSMYLQMKNTHMR